MGVVEEIDLTQDDDAVGAARPPAAKARPSRSLSALRLVTFNVDGLNAHHLGERTAAALALVLSQSPDVIFLQEVVPATAQLLQPALAAHGYLCSDDLAVLQRRGVHYFTLTFARSAAFSTLRFAREDFSSAAAASRQGRDMVKCWATTAQGMQVLAINLHLESTGKAMQSPESALRQGQLQEALEALGHHDGPGVVGGDLNIRDAEARAVLARHRVRDVAEALGLPLERSNTWFMPGRSAVSCRFDRVYCAVGPCRSLQATSCRLVGHEPVLAAAQDEGGYLTPSDHRALVVDFALPVTTPSLATATSTTSAIAAIPVPAGSGSGPQPPEGTASASADRKRRRELQAEAAIKRLAAAPEAQCK